VQFPSDFRLILASQSPRRHSLLRDVGIPFTVVRSDAEEALDGKPAAVLAEENALAKMRGAVLPPGLAPGSFVLGTDTLVTVGGAVMGKPASVDEARRMLGALAGRVHQVVSGVALGRTGDGDPAASRGRPAAGDAARAGSPASPAGYGQVRVGHASTEVTFLPLGPGQIEAYLETGEWKGKAGGYAVQGIAGLFVSEIRGEYSNVVGLPLCLLARLFLEAGFDIIGRQWA
jgi:septum formation protein